MNSEQIERRARKGLVPAAVQINLNSPLLSGILALSVLIAVGGWFYSSVTTRSLNHRINELERQNKVLDATIGFVGEAYRLYDLKEAPSYIRPEDPKIAALAERLRTPESAYLFVRDQVKYSSYASKHVSARTVLDARRGDCMGQANLLMSLLRAVGVPPGRMVIVYGSVWQDRDYYNHGWIEYWDEGQKWILDPTKYLGVFEFKQWKAPAYYKRFKARARFIYNETGSEMVR